MKKRILLALGLASLLALAGCTKKAADTTTSSESTSESVSESSSESASASKELKTITVGASPAPHAEILEAAKPVLKEEGYDLKIVEYNDYIQPNVALDSKELDANYFQHYPYLENFNKEHNTTLVSAGAIHYEPFGIYAGKTATLDALKDGAKVSVPNDATNGGRALKVLESAGVIKVNPDAGYTPTLNDITENAKNIKFTEVEAANTPSLLPDVAAAVINGGHAVDNGLNPKTDSIFLEKVEDGVDNPYVNIIVARSEDKDNEIYQKIVKAYQSDDVKKVIEEVYKGAYIPAWK